MNVSVVIPVRQDICLPNAIASVPQDVELIVAMTSPPIDEIRYVKSLSLNRNLRIEVTNRIGMAAGVNLGAQLASHEKVVVLDSDCRLLNGTLNSYSNSLSHYSFVRGITLVERSCYWSRIAALGTENMNKTFKYATRFFGPSIAFRKSAFFYYGGYDEKMVHGSCDHEFAIRLEKYNQYVYFDSEAVIVHRPITFEIDTRSHIGYGRGMCYIDKKHGNKYGLSVCLKGLNPKEIYKKAIERGGMSVIRSILLGVLMLYAYFKDYIRK